MIQMGISISAKGERGGTTPPPPAVLFTTTWTTTAPGQGIILRGGCVMGFELFLVLRGHHRLPFAQQELSGRAPHVNRQGLPGLQHVDRNRDVLHAATSTLTRAAKAHISS